MLIILPAFLILTSLVLLKRILFFTYLWQNREYRLDKMLDFINLPESRLAFSERWTQVRILTLLLLNLTLLLGTGVLWAEIIFWLILGLEGLQFVYKLLRNRKGIKVPKFTNKASVLFGLGSILIVPVTLYLQLLSMAILEITDIDVDKLVILSAWLSIFVGLMILIIPFVIGTALGILWPLDWFFKRRLVGRAKSHRAGLNNLKVVAISGSFGKSTTKEILSSLLSSYFRTTKTPGFNNTPISTAREFLKLTEKDEVFISELGSYRKGDGHEICEFTQPNCALITGLNHQHFSLFGSEENIIAGESEALDYLQKGDPVVINWDSEMCRKIEVKDRLKLIKYSIHDKTAGYYSKIISYDGNHTTFKLTFAGKTHILKTNLFSLGNIQNLTGALALALELGVGLDELKPVLLELKLPAATLHTLDRDYGKLLDDSHNANLDGVLNALESLNLFELPKYVILDDILELGPKTKQAHEEVARKLFEIKPELVVLCGKSFPRFVRDELLNLGYQDSKIILSTAANRENLVAQIKAEIEVLGQAVVLLEGYQSRYFTEI